MAGIWPIAVAGATAAYYFISRRDKGSKWPSGPRGVPFLGNVLQLRDTILYMKVTAWQQKYGNIFSINLFGQNVIVVSGEEAITEALMKMGNDFADRPSEFRISYMFNNRPSVIVGSMCPRWSLHKKTEMNAIKMISDGFRNIEDIMVKIVDDLCRDLGELDGQECDPAWYISTAVIGIMTSLVFGFQMSKSLGMRYYKTVKEIASFNRPDGPGWELDIFPWLQYLPNHFLKRMTVLRTEKDSIIAEATKICRDQYDSANPDCLVDQLWVLQEKEEAAIGKEQGERFFTDVDIQGIVEDMLMAGTSTTSATMLSFLLVCINNPDLQSRIQAEVDRVMGQRQPCLADRGEMPYIEAVIFEMLRYLTTAPLAVPHSASKDVEFRGYHIPKGTGIWLNLWSLHHDELYWDEPWKFKPERFLDESGKLYPPSHLIRKRLMPFGAGRRVCVGENFAKNRLFLLITTLLQRFTFLPPLEGKIASCDPRTFPMSFVLGPDAFRLRAVPRT